MRRKGKLKETSLWGKLNSVKPKENEEKVNINCKEYFNVEDFVL